MGLARNIIGGTLAGGAAIFAGAGALSDDTTRNETGEITAAGGVGAYKVRVGDCIQLPDDAVEVVSVEGVPCTTPHGAQAFASFALPNLPAFPSSDEMMEADREVTCFVISADGSPLTGTKMVT